MPGDSPRLDSISTSSKKGGWLSAIAVAACLLLVIDTTLARGGFRGGGGLRGAGGFDRGDLEASVNAALVLVHLLEVPDDVKLIVGTTGSVLVMTGIHAEERKEPVRATPRAL